jgi:3-dehydro-L-gulonate 2-dehydrogenase
MLRVPFTELASTLAAILVRIGFDPNRAEHCARLFAETTRDGVYSHGVERFPRFLEMICNGTVDIHATPECTQQFGALERWDGHRGPGNLNAWASMARAIELSADHGIGCVALANTNHWMRGGSYGWQAADAGVIGVCWTNTLANLPPWGASVPALGNNPLIIAVPRPAGHVVLDVAMSQFSYGALATYRRTGHPLPVDGGFDAEGHLTRDPAAIMLDMVAALLSGGLATHQIPTEPVKETGLSQIFLALNLAKLQPTEASAQAADAIVDSLLASGASVRYPGQQVLKTRAENLALGLPVREELWDNLLSL